MRTRLASGLLVATSILGVGGLSSDVTAEQQSAPVAKGAEEIKVPETPVWLGSVRIPSAVIVDGGRLDAGTYRLRLTGETAKPPVVGQAEKLEQWVEFHQGSDMKGRAVASIVPGAAIKDVAEGTPPAPGRSTVERLKGGDYLRVWVNHKGDHVLLNLALEAARG